MLPAPRIAPSSVTFVAALCPHAQPLSSTPLSCRRLRSPDNAHRPKCPSRQKVCERQIEITHAPKSTQHPLPFLPHSRKHLATFLRLLPTKPPTSLLSKPSHRSNHHFPLPLPTGLLSPSRNLNFTPHFETPPPTFSARPNASPLPSSTHPCHQPPLAQSSCIALPCPNSQQIPPHPSSISHHFKKNPPSLPFSHRNESTRVHTYFCLPPSRILCTYNTHRPDHTLRPTHPCNSPDTPTNANLPTASSPTPVPYPHLYALLTPPHTTSPKHHLNRDNTIPRNSPQSPDGPALPPAHTSFLPPRPRPICCIPKLSPSCPGPPSSPFEE